MKSTAVHKERVDVIVTMANGEVHHGKITCGLTPDLAGALNRDGLFVEFTDMTGRSRFIAKSAVAEVEAAPMEGAPAMSRRFENDSADPWTVLGVPKDTPFEAVREAYHQLVKQYHPDRIASAELPKDMQAYATAVLRQLNSAYEILKRTNGHARAA